MGERPPHLVPLPSDVFVVKKFVSLLFLLLLLRFCSLLELVSDPLHRLPLQLLPDKQRLYGLIF